MSEIIHRKKIINSLGHTIYVQTDEKSVLCDNDTKTLKDKLEELDDKYIGIPTGGSNGLSLKKTSNGTEWDDIDYEDDIISKPKINNVPLSGNKTALDLGLATSQQINQLNDKFDKLPSGYYYGKFNSVEDLPEAAEKGYAYVASSDPTVFYTYLVNEAGGKWYDSGNKIVNTIDLTTPKTSGTELSKGEKYYASANVNDRPADVVTETGVVKSLGYKLLNPALSFASQLTDTNTIYEIRDEFNLNGESVTIPAGCILKFNGGKVLNGVLVGAVRFYETLNLENIGIIYNDNTKGVHNKNCLGLLNGITSDINIELTGDLYLAIGNNVTACTISNNFSLNGNSNTIYTTNGGTIFNCKSDVSIGHVKVESVSIEDANTKLSYFLTIADSVNHSRISIHDCYFTGNLRVLTNERLTDTNLENYFEKIEIKNNVFKNIATLTGSNICLKLGDTNYTLLEFSGNTIHNFYSTFLSCGITNGSTHVTNIKNFYQKSGRKSVIENNVVYNDISFKPWRFNKRIAYFCFALLEKGDCIFRNNTLRNIIGKDANNTTYDAYLSVNNLLFENNDIENCVNLEDSYNEILKSKGSGGFRKFIHNRFIETSLTIDNVEYTPSFILCNTASAMDNLVLENNIFSLENLILNKNYNWQFKNIFIQNNSMTIANGISMGAIATLFISDKITEYVSIENNNIDIQSIETPVRLFNAEYFKGTLSIRANKLTNMSLIYDDVRVLKGVVSSNIITYNSNVTGDFLFVRTASDTLEISDTIIYMTQDAVWSSRVCLFNYKSGINFKRNKIYFNVAHSYYTKSLHLIPATNQVGDMRNVIVKMILNGVEVVSEATFAYKANVTNLKHDYETCNIYNTNRTLATNAGNQTAVFNTNGAGVIKYYGGYLYYPNAANDELEITIEERKITDLTDFSYPPVGRENRPSADIAKIGYMYDTTIQLPIFSDGFCWRKADGTVIFDDIGTLEERLAVTTKTNMQYNQPTLLTDTPADWTTNYSNYYKIVDSKFVHLTEPETFASDTYYKDNIILYDGTDWRNILNRSVYIDDSGSLNTMHNTYANNTSTYIGIQVKLTDSDAPLKNKIVKWVGDKWIDTATRETMKAATPVITFVDDNNTTIASVTCATSSATLRYTLDGTDPTSESTQYTGSEITLASGSVLKVKAFRLHIDDSDTAFVKVASPQIAFTSEGVMTITCDTANAEIYYTTNGDEPTSASTLYIDEVTVEKNTTVKAIAILTGRVNSEIVTDMFE